MIQPVNNFFNHKPPSNLEAEEAFEEINEFITQDNLEFLEHQRHDESIGEATELNKDAALEQRDESFLSLGSNTLGTALGIINMDEGLEGIKEAAKKDDTPGLVNSFFRSFKGFFELIEKSLSSSKNFIEGSRLLSINATSSMVVGSTIVAGASGASLSLLAITSMSALEKQSFAKKHQDLLKAGIKDPSKSMLALNALRQEINVSKEEKKSLFDALFQPPSTLDRLKKTIMGLFVNDPVMAKCKQALLDPASCDLKTLSESLPTLSKNPLEELMDIVEIPTSINITSKQDLAAYKKILSHVYSKTLKQYEEKKNSTFSRIFGEDVRESILELSKEETISISKTKVILTKASQNLSREVERSFIKLFGALLVAATTVLSQIATNGAFYIAETALCLIISACSLISEIYAIVKCVQSQKLSLQEKIKTAVLSIMMIFLITSSAVILRMTISPIATGILTVSWLLMTCYTVYLWLSKKSAHASEENPNDSTTSSPKQKNALLVLDKLC